MSPYATSPLDSGAQTIDPTALADAIGTDIANALSQYNFPTDNGQGISPITIIPAATTATSTATSGSKPKKRHGIASTVSTSKVRKSTPKKKKTATKTGSIVTPRVLPRAYPVSKVVKGSRKAPRKIAPWQKVIAPRNRFPGSVGAKR